MNKYFLNASHTLTVCLFAAIWIRSGSIASAQVQSGTTLSASITEYQCVQRSPHSRVWQRAVLQTNQANVVRTNLHSYTELATGLCYLQNGQYVDAVEQIDIVANGAQAIQGRHQVYWAANANTPGGAVKLITPDGRQLLSAVYGLLYYDSSSGSSVLLTGVQDCTATIISNTLIYDNAFSNLTADVLYTYRKAGLSQNIILRQQPPSPDAYGMNPATTWLQVLTEFFSPPMPVITTGTNNGVLDARRLKFGDMKMGVGHAFLSESNGGTLSGTSVIKSWTNIDNRTFLIEEVPYSSISNLLSSLHSSLIKPDKSKVQRTVFLGPSKPKVSAAKPAQPVKALKTMPKETGLVLDYDIASGEDNITFQGDTTYYISGEVTIDRAAIFEGGTVIKYTNTADAQINTEDGDGPGPIFETSLYRPAIFTSSDDDSVGDGIDGSTGTPSTNGVATYMNGGTGVIQGARFSYAGTALLDVNGAHDTFQDCQFFECGTNFISVNPGVSFKNVLSSDCRYMAVGYGFGPDGIPVDCENITVDSCANFPFAGTVTNSILTAVGGVLTNLVFDHSVVAANGAGIYQTAGAGGYYLINGSTNRNAGTTNIDPVLLADLKTKTTYPPVTNFYGFLTNDYTFSPQVQRDNSGSTVDLGYHYDPLDYAGFLCISNATATVLPGTALGMAGPEYGVWLHTTATFNSTGTATSPNYIVCYNTVQEQSNTNWESPGGCELFYLGEADSTFQSANFRFTQWSVLAASEQINGESDGASLFTFQDCQFYGGTIYTVSPTVLITNCLFQRVYVNLDDDDSYISVSNSLYNNLFWQGSFNLNHNIGDGNTITFRDNLFDQMPIASDYDYPLIVDVCSNNAYVTTNFGMLLPSNDDAILADSPAYEAGFLGQYYYPTDFTNLIHQGSRSSSAAALYQYTVTTNNAIEGTNIVSIGFHYVATDAYGVPLDSNGDGIPNYLEDYNGNGLADPGETNWLAPPLIVRITQPANNSKIP